MRFFEAFASALAGFYALIPSYGLAIILLTLAVRILLLPLSIKQTKSMREMQRIQPEIKKLQAKYKGNRQKLNEEMMALYKEHSVNPFGGCLPLLMQFPVLIALFYVVREPLNYLGHLADSALYRALESTPLAVNQFLGIRLDCSASAALGGQAAAADVVCGTGVLDALPYLLLVAVMGATTWYQQKQMQMSRGTDATAQQMQMFMKIMPIMLMVFAYSFPTGVVIYWVTTNLWTIAQQRIVLAAVPQNSPSTAPGNGTKGSKKTPKLAAAGAEKTSAKPAKGDGTGKGKPAKTSAAATKSKSAKTGASGSAPKVSGAAKPSGGAKKKKKR